MMPDSLLRDEDVVLSRHRLFRGALVASAALHAAAIMAAPYWPQARRAEEPVVSVALADISPRELPPIPRLPSDAPPPPASADVAPVPAAATVAPRALPGRETIREDVSRKGLLAVLARRAPAGDPLTRLGPLDAVPHASRERPSSRDDLPAGGAVAPASAAADGPGVGRQIRSAPRTSTAVVSRIFTTDAGLEGRITGGEGDRTRSEGAILKTIEQYRSGIKYAYDRELMTNPDISGEIAVSFVILADGSVSQAAVRASTVKWPSLEEAVLARVRRMRFAPAAGGPVQVLFPFRFLPEM